MKFVQENLLAWWRNPHPLATTDRKYSSNMLTSALTVFTSLDEAKKLSLYNIFLNGFFLMVYLWFFIYDCVFGDFWFMFFFNVFFMISGYVFYL
jgi:hypothetical protein